MNDQEDGDLPRLVKRFKQISRDPDWRLLQARLKHQSDCGLCHRVWLEHCAVLGMNKNVDHLSIDDVNKIFSDEFVTTATERCSDFPKGGAPVEHLRPGGPIKPRVTEPKHRQVHLSIRQRPD
jgi:hypothetical protein